MSLELVVRMLGDSSGLVKAANEGGAGIEVMGKRIDVGGIGKAVALAGAVGIAAGAIVGMTQAAAADRDEQLKLEAAIAAAGAATATSTEQVEAAIAAGQAKAFSDSETRAGLESLVTATGDMTQATELMAIAQDVARKANVSLEDASKAVAKAHAGQDGALRKLLPGMEKQASATDTMAEAARLASGQADLYAKSSAGMAARGSDSFGEIAETIGSVFLPILDEVLPALLPIIQTFGKLITALLPVLIPLVKLLAAALGVVAKVITVVVDALVKLITWLAKAIQKVASFLGSLGPVKAAGDFIGGIIGRSASAAAPSGRTGAGAPMAAGGATAGWQSGGQVTMVLDGEVFGRATIAAVRRYDRRNGPAQVIPRWS